jgi:porin
MWRRLLLCLLLCAAVSGNLAQAKDANADPPAPETVALPPELQPSIASSISVFAEFKKGLFDLGYNLQLNYTGEVLGNPTGASGKA